jgi:large subunit ribosomal protein L18
MSTLSRKETRKRRQKRVRRKILGTPEKPRLCVFRSLKHIYAEVIDDVSGRTLVEASSVSKALSAQIGKEAGNAKGAAMVGKAVAERAANAGIRRVVFDRNGFLYHGRVKALADAAREGGLEF